MDRIEDADDDIDDGQLLFIGSNKEKFNFNTFRKPLSSISAIYKGEISLKETDFFQKELEKKIEELQFDYRSKKKKEKEEINGVLMQANDLLEYRNKITDAFKDTSLSNHLKKSDNAAYNYMLKDVNKFIKEVKSMEEKINLSFFEDFFQSSSPADYAKELINTSNPDKNKEIVEEIENRILDLKDRIKEKSKREKKRKNVDETLGIIKKILDYNKDAQKFFHLASKVDNGKSKPKIEESIAERVKLKNEKIAEIKKEEKNIENELFKYYFINYQKPSDMYKKLRKAKDKINECKVYSIKEILDEIKKNKNVPKKNLRLN